MNTNATRTRRRIEAKINNVKTPWLLQVQCTAGVDITIGVCRNLALQERSLTIHDNSQYTRREIAKLTEIADIFV